MAKSTLRLQKSKTPKHYKWFGLLALAVVIFGTMTLPKGLGWARMYSRTQDLSQSIEQDRQALSVLQQEVQALRNDITVKQAATSNREAQMFPAEINPGKVAKTLELMGLGLGNLSTITQASVFELQQLSFGQTLPAAERDATATSLQIRLATDATNLKDFIVYLQTGGMPERVTEGYQSNKVPQPDYQFLTENRLPLLLIDTLDIVESPDPEVFEVTIGTRLFSQSQ